MTTDDLVKVARIVLGIGAAGVILFALWLGLFLVAVEVFGP